MMDREPVKPGDLAVTLHGKRASYLQPTDIPKEGTFVIVGPVADQCNEKTWFFLEGWGNLEVSDRVLLKISPSPSQFSKEREKEVAHED